MLNKIRLALILCSLFVVGVTQAASRYTHGDCITPTTESYTWFGKYARVEAFTEIEGYPGKNYILAFPKSISNDVIFGKEIEQHTKKVDKKLCSRM